MEKGTLHQGSEKVLATEKSFSIFDPVEEAVFKKVIFPTKSLARD